MERIILSPNETEEVAVEFENEQTLFALLTPPDKKLIK